MPCPPMSCTGASDCPDRECPGRVWTESVNAGLEATQAAVRARPATPRPARDLPNPTNVGDLAPVVIPRWIKACGVLALFAIVAALLRAGRLF